MASVEHPILGVLTSQEYVDDPSGDRVRPLNRSLVEGPRVRRWFVDGVEKRHRTLAAYVNSIIDAGLALDRLVAWGPSAAEIEARPHLADDVDRPWFLVIRVTVA
ncbi:MAG: hypothetical protein AAGD33_05920 [Actinomycetota bacterium]